MSRQLKLDANELCHGSLRGEAAEERLKHGQRPVTQTPVTGVQVNRKLFEDFPKGQTGGFLLQKGAASLYPIVDT